MGWDGMDGILLRSLVQLEHLAVLIKLEPFMFPVFPVDFFGLYYCGSAARKGRGLYLSLCCLLGSNQNHQLKIFFLIPVLPTENEYSPSLQECITVIYTSEESQLLTNHMDLPTKCEIYLKS